MTSPTEEGGIRHNCGRCRPWASLMSDAQEPANPQYQAASDKMKKVSIRAPNARPAEDEDIVGIKGLDLKVNNIDHALLRKAQSRCFPYSQPWCNCRPQNIPPSTFLYLTGL